jgi:Aspartyl protease
MKTIGCGFPSNAEVQGRDLLVQFGPTMQVDIGFDPSFVDGAGVAPDLPMKGVHALVDTGATDSCIDSALAMQLNLPIIDQRTCGGISGAMQVNMHLAHIHIPGLPHTLYGAFAGVNLAAGGQPHLVLIGRTFLQRFYMFYDGHTGTVAIFDEMPSVPPAPQAAT